MKLDSELPDGTVPCGVDEPRCVLAYAYYADGLCVDNLGKLLVGRGMTYAVKWGRLGLCPFYAVLSITEIQE